MIFEIAANKTFRYLSLKMKRNIVCASLEYLNDHNNVSYKRGNNGFKLFVDNKACNLMLESVKLIIKRTRGMKYYVHIDLDCDHDLLSKIIKFEDNISKDSEKSYDIMSVITNETYRHEIICRAPRKIYKEPEDGDMNNAKEELNISNLVDKSVIGTVIFETFIGETVRTMFEKRTICSIAAMFIQENNFGYEEFNVIVKT
jgi:hypothetical protein